MRSLSLLLLLLLLCSGLARAGALAEPELGLVEVAVADRSPALRREALREGLDRVLVRLTGQTDVDGQAELDGLRAASPTRWVAQYSYREREDDSGEEQSDAAPEQPPLMLQARFDVDGLLQRLGELDAPVWDQKRPAVLLWAVLQQPGSGRILARASDHPVRQRIEAAARARGLPVVLPRMDARDEAAIQAADIRGRFDEPLRKASARYDTRLVATAVFYPGTSPRVRWRLLDSGRERIGGNLTPADLDTGVAQWIGRITDHLVELYAVRGQGERAVSLRVDGVARLQHWRELQDFLGGLAGVRRVHLRQLDGETVIFDVRFAGPLAKLERLAKLLPGLGNCDDERILAAVSTSRGLSRDGAAEEGETAGGAGAGRADYGLRFCWARTE